MLLNIADTADSGLNCLIIAAICAYHARGDKFPVRSIRAALTTFMHRNSLAELLRDAICARICSCKVPGRLMTNEARKYAIQCVRDGEPVGEPELCIAADILGISIVADVGDGESVVIGNYTGVTAPGVKLVVGAATYDLDVTNEELDSVYALFETLPMNT